MKTLEEIVKSVWGNGIEYMDRMDYAEALAAAVIAEVMPEELSEAAIKTGWNLCREEMLFRIKELGL